MLKVVFGLRMFVEDSFFYLGSILLDFAFLHKQNVGKWIGLVGVGIYHCVFSYMASVIFFEGCDVVDM